METHSDGKWKEFIKKLNYFYSNTNFRYEYSKERVHVQIKLIQWKVKVDIVENYQSIRKTH